MKTKFTAPSFVHGWNPDLPMIGDEVYNSKIDFPTHREWKDVVDLRPIMPPVYNQGHSGSSTAQAIVAHLAALHTKRDEIYEQRSRLFLYYNARSARNATASDSGAMLRDALKSITTIGVCSEEFLQYDPTGHAVLPSWQCYEDAKNYRAIKYYGVKRLQEMITCLSNGYPFVIGFTAYEELTSGAVDSYGRLPLPKRGSRALGGHAVLVVGYNLMERIFLVRNSWGELWGRAGHFWMPFDYLQTTELCGSGWTIRFPNY